MTKIRLYVANIEISSATFLSSTAKSTCNQSQPIWFINSLVPPLKSYIPNKEYLQSIDQFLDLFDNEAMNFYDLSLSQSYVSNVTALAPINMLTAPMDFWHGS